MKNKKPVTTTIHRTNETPATAPARHAAFKTVADMTPRELALFHLQKAKKAIESMEYEEIQDYGDENSEFSKSEAATLVSLKKKIIQHLSHIEAIAVESASIGDTKALPAPKAE